ncbi:cell division protein FtsQ [Bifidobacterium sp. DSM 109959]|uniref:Cell division protein FtsQ n=1 Tax=Bifidobacterium olomucense TaxID=2675324 RepID=A0A7Y0EWJ3_9BIFI|nr:FtsQ-type POTRA domain-containing protein [Bifidobacterium sp. DSM 109959]NMM97746.1 cell division protein FtsQ [Bifidobacterium sp. DSM 109959]
MASRTVRSVSSHTTGNHHASDEPRRLPQTGEAHQSRGVRRPYGVVRSSQKTRKPHRGRTIESYTGSKASGARLARSRKPRTVTSDASDVQAELVPDVTVANGPAGAFVDARRLPSEDYVTETLRQTTGMLGVASRPKVVNFAERTKEHRRASARVIALRALVAVAVVAALVALFWLLFFSSVFRLETNRIEVSGANEWVSASTIHKIADQQSGKSLFMVSTNDVAEQLKDIPGVSQAKVTKHFPKAMSVEVTAQRPAAMLKSGDTLVAVDSDARVLNSVTAKDVSGIPVIETKDAQASLKNRSIKEALAILGALPESMRQSITKVTAETQDSVTTVLDDGARVIVWGDSSQLKLKMAVVDKIINDPKVIGNKQQVDVSAPLKPIIK